MNDLRHLAILLESHQARAMRELARESEPLGGGVLSFDRVGSFLNVAVGLGLERPLSSAELDRIVTFFVERGVEPKVELTPYADPTTLAGLAARNFVLRDFQTKLYRDLGNRDEPAPSWPSDLVIERVDATSATSVDEYARLAASGFVAPGEAIDEADLSFSRTASARPSFAAFIAKLDGESVGAGAVDTKDGIAALINASVQHGHRGLGIQRALIAARLDCARTRGCRYATIACEPGIATERNARRMGFAVAYTRTVFVKSTPGLAPAR